MVFVVEVGFVDLNGLNRIIEHEFDFGIDILIMLLNILYQ
jgi:hypothetical protein